MELADQIFRYDMNVKIQITGTETKKNTIRDAILNQLQLAKDAGNIDKANWNINQSTVPEGGSIS